MGPRTLSPLAVLALAIAGCVALDGLAGGDDSTRASGRSSSRACSAAGAPKCEHGSCVDEDGSARCACDAGWTGATCNECSVGSVCSAPSCAETKCAAHSTCNDSSGTPTCACVVGYEPAGSDCVWKGVVRDPTFEDSPAGAWTVTGGVTIDASVKGAKDPGLAELKTAACTEAGVKQSFAMPAVSTAEPLAMEIHARGTCQLPFIGGGLNIPCARPISVSIAGRGVEPFSLLYGDGSSRMCLGERAFGGPIELELFPSLCGSSVKSLALDHVAIVTAPECPAPGIVTNGDFEGVGGWTVSGTGAEVAASVGNQGSRGGRLHSTKRCDNPRLTGAFSIPLATPARPALTFTAKGTVNRRMRVYGNNGTVLGTIAGTAVYEKVSLCMPEYLKGMAPQLAFGLDDDQPDGSCGDPDDYEFVFDDVKVEDDPACTDAHVIDGGFERADVARYWQKTESDGSVTFVRSSPNGAKSGSGFVRLTQSGCSRTSSVSSVTTLPAKASGKGGPAIEFFYKATSATGITYRANATDLPPATDWTKSRVCFSSRRSGFSASITLAASAGDTCGAGSLSIDDVRTVHDAACPE